MKQIISYTNSQPSVIQFISIWKRNKHYSSDETLTIGECIELLIATTYNLHFDYSDGRFFNKIITNDESVVAWDGDELIDILYYEVTRAILNRLSKGGTFNEVIEK